MASYPAAGRFQDGADLSAFRRPDPSAVMLPTTSPREVESQGLPPQPGSMGVMDQNPVPTDQQKGIQALAMLLSGSEPWRGQGQW